MVPGSRRESRERALELLYEAEAKGQPPQEVVAAQTLRPDPFVLELVEGVEARGAELDEVLGRFAKGWAVDRMPVLDRAILRMAVFELVAQPRTPVAVVISEAVELAKRYSTEESGKFVNGVLAGVAAEVRPPAPDAVP
ncbi:MAG: transcription antitermination factor NusB [Actinobacteria bacterium]|nr:transcription antitermination factor NusB [Actinomycetota bacterium]